MSHSIYSVDPPSYQQLISAIKNNEIDRLNCILQQEKFTEQHDIDRPVIVNCTGFPAAPALWYALYYNSSTAIMTSLLQYGGANPNRTNHALSLACDEMNYEKIQLLLQYNANVHQCSLGQEPPLFRLCRVEDTEVVESFIQKKLSCFRLLFEYGADVNHRGDGGETPLFRVCKIFAWGNDRDKQIALSIIRLLVEEYHADVNIRNKHHGMTPLFHIVAHTTTVTSYHLEAMRLLLQHHANVTIQSLRNYGNDGGRIGGNIGDTILHCAVRRNQIELVQLFMEEEYYNPRLLTTRNKRHHRENVWDIAYRLRHESIMACIQQKLRHECYKFIQQQTSNPILWKTTTRTRKTNHDNIGKRTKIDHFH